MITYFEAALYLCLTMTFAPHVFSALIVHTAVIGTVSKMPRGVAPLLLAILGVCVALCAFPSVDALGDNEIYALNATYNEFQAALSARGWSGSGVLTACSPPILSGLTCSIGGNVTKMFVL